MVTATTTAQELDSRAGEGIHVRLMWSAHDDYLFVAVTDRKHGAEFCVEVRDHARALDVFHHPFAYAAQPGPVGSAERADATLSR